MKTENESLPQRHSGASGNLPEHYTVQDARISALACRSVGQALSAPTIRQLERQANPQVVGVELMAVIESGQQFFGAHRRMSSAQVGLVAEEIQSRYPHESLADIALFMRGASMGLYGKKGQEGETFGALDPQRLFVWFSEYLEEKAIAREQEAVAVDKAHEGRFQALAAIPGFTDVLRKVRGEGRAEREENRDGRRLALLRDTVKLMHDDDLREAYKLNRDAASRSIILTQAIERGLLGEEFRINPNTEQPKQA